MAANPIALECEDVDCESTIKWIRFLHRAPDGYVLFSSRDLEGRVIPSLLVRAGSVASVFPGLLEQFSVDGYCSINSSDGRGLPADEGKLKKILQFQPDSGRALVKGRSLHTAKRMLYLNACMVDCDCHSISSNEVPGTAMSPNEVLRSVALMCRLGKLPEPTFFSRSGRGVWFFWRLSSVADQSRPEEATGPGSLARYQAVNAQLSAMLTSAGADMQCKDAARVTGLHGSYKTRGQRTVSWELFGSGKTYALRELEEQVGIELRGAVQSTLSRKARKAVTRDPSMTPEMLAARQKGRAVQQENYLKVIEVLTQLRGGFALGDRNSALFAYSLVLKSAGIPKAEARDLAIKFGQTWCKPTFAASECLSCVTSVYAQDVEGGDRYWCVSYQWLADRLGVTVLESESISDRLGKHFPPASRYGSVAKELSRTEKRDEILQAIQQEMVLGGDVSSLRKLQGALFRRGKKVSVTTLRRYREQVPSLARRGEEKPLQLQRRLL